MSETLRKINIHPKHPICNYYIFQSSQHIPFIMATFSIEMQHFPSRMATFVVILMRTCLQELSSEATNLIRLPSATLMKIGYFIVKTMIVENYLQKHILKRTSFLANVHDLVSNRDVNTIVFMNFNTSHSLFFIGCRTWGGRSFCTSFHEKKEFWSGGLWGQQNRIPNQMLCPPFEIHFLGTFLARLHPFIWSLPPGNSLQKSPPRVIS